MSRTPALRQKRRCDRRQTSFTHQRSAGRHPPAPHRNTDLLSSQAHKPDLQFGLVPRQNTELLSNQVYKPNSRSGLLRM